MEGDCVYCRIRPAIERDHVVPRGLFPKPRPNLITVPSCEECNRGYSKDEEYFRLIVTGDLRVVHRSEDARSLLEGPVARSLQRSRGLRNLLLDNVVGLVPRQGVGALKNGSLMLEYDIERLKRVIEKIVLGLFFHEFSECLPRDHRVILKVNTTPEDLPDRIGRWLAQGTPKSLGGDIFRYIVRRPRGSKTLTWWLFWFYDAFFAMGATAPTDGVI